MVNETPQCIQNGRHSRLCSRVVTNRVRDRESSRISLRKVLQSLKCRKLRRKHKKMLKMSVPVSSVCIVFHHIINNGISGTLRDKTVSTVITRALPEEARVIK